MTKSSSSSRARGRLLVQPQHDCFVAGDLTCVRTVASQRITIEELSRELIERENFPPLFKRALGAFCVVCLSSRCRRNHGAGAHCARLGTVGSPTPPVAPRCGPSSRCRKRTRSSTCQCRRWSAFTSASSSRQSMCQCRTLNSQCLLVKRTLPAPTL